MKPERTQVWCPEHPDDEVTITGHPHRPHRLLAATEIQARP